MADTDESGTKQGGAQLQELAAMKVIAEELAKLEPATVMRVLRWAGDAFKPKGASAVTEAAAEAGGGEASCALKGKYESLADLYSKAGPSQANDKALLVGYWLQVIQDMGDFDAQSVNKELKHLGHGVANITSAFDSLIARKPQLVIQTRKSGTSRQARKLYKLTLEGQRAVERMLSGEEQ